jgi:[CysO sulfur-carrier protein]-S-L-cysteine hydrolase
MPKAIAFPRTLVNRLLHHAQGSPHAEICGLIGSRRGTPTSCYPVSNIAGQPSTRFRMDPEEQIRALRTMREHHEELFAIYHSHPSAPAAPSAADLEQAGYPDALQIIISLNTKGVLEMRGFFFDGNARPEEISLQIFNG